MKKIKVAIAGATGFAGVELIRLLLQHEDVQITTISSVSFEGKKISEVYPSLIGACDLTCKNENELFNDCDIVFAALPHGLSEKLAKIAIEKDKKLIDLGADFRLEDEEDYKLWYENDYKEPQLHKLAVYSIPELHRKRLEEKSIVANPGCYPTSIALGTFPALKNNLVELENIIIDSKSGVSGAGRQATLGTHYCFVNEGFAPYKVATHRHTPEIEQTLSQFANQKIKVTFVPHLLPVNRGIVSTIYLNLNKAVSFEQIKESYKEAYKNEPFVKVLDEGLTANLNHVKLTNNCEISLHFDERNHRLVVVSAIDNMIKGAAGQAIQNMNLMFGLKETSGLNLISLPF